MPLRALGVLFGFSFTSLGSPVECTTSVPMWLPMDLPLPLAIFHRSIEETKPLL